MFTYRVQFGTSEMSAPLEVKAENWDDAIRQGKQLKEQYPEILSKAESGVKMIITDGFALHSEVLDNGD